MTYSFKKIIESRDKAIDSILDEANSRFTSALNTQLEVWGSKYHRHTFKALEGHGMLTIHVSPPLHASLLGSTGDCLNWTESKYARGALKVLLQEVEYIIDLYNSSDFNISIVYEGSL